MGKSTRILCIVLLLWSMLCLSVEARILSTPLAPCMLTDIDRDDDGLIEICDLEALDAVRYQLDGSGYRAAATAIKITAGCSIAGGCKGYELVADLDFNNDADYRNIENKNIWSGGKGWKPIGNIASPFSAIFAAHGYTIANLRIHRNMDSIGLFGRLRKDAEIRGLRLLNVDIKGDFWTAALVGFNEGKVIGSGVEGGNLISIGATSGGLVGANIGMVINSYGRTNLTGSDAVGGLVGDNRHWIINSYAYGHVIDAASDVGGLVGRNSGAIINSYAAGDIRGDANNVGGLVGYNDGWVGSSYARSRVKGVADNVGGLIGLNNKSLSDSYVMGHTQKEYDVHGRYRVGGLVGYNRASIVNSYATASVAGLGYTGGLVGLNNMDSTAAEGTVVNSYWNVTTSRVTRSAGGLLRSSTQLKSPTVAGNAATQSYYDWDTRNWDFGTAQHYPLLKYAEVMGTTRTYITCKRPRVSVSANEDAYQPIATESSLSIPNCGDLLSGQYTRLSSLIFLDGLTLYPSFDPEIFNYRIVLGDSREQLRLIAFAADRDNDISIVGDRGFSRAVESGARSAVPLDRSADGSLITIARQYKIDVIYPLIIKGIPAHHRVQEGADLRLEVSSVGNLPTAGRHYEWIQLSGVPLLSGSDTQHPVLDIKVPENLVARSDDSSDVVLRVHVSDAAGNEYRETTLTIVKTENGDSPTRLAAPIFTETTFALLAPAVKLEDVSADADGIEILDILGYQWQIGTPSAVADWRDIEGAVARSYRIPVGLNLANRTRYRVWVNYRDGQGYENNGVVSEEFVLPLMDIDRDDDGLIEIYYLEDLAAMRHQRDGSGYRESSDAEKKITAGCPAGTCSGYELARDLDFNREDSYRDINNKSKWIEHDRWEYIGGSGDDDAFTAIFEGNNRTISNFKIHDTEQSFVSLFGRTQGTIMNLGLLDVDVVGQTYIGSLAGLNEGVIANCYATGSVVSITDNFRSAFGSLVGGLVGHNGSLNSDNGALVINSFAHVYVAGNAEYVGGLIGDNRALIINSYVGGNIQGDSTDIGGLVGFNRRNGIILNSYARGSVRGGSRVGGLVGYSQGRITHSYAAVTLSGSTLIGGLVGDSEIGVQVTDSYWDHSLSDIAYGAVGSSKTTVELQSAVASTVFGYPYYRWSNNDWDFGSTAQYPTLKYAAIPASVQDSISASLNDVCVSPTHYASGIANDNDSRPICGTSLPDKWRGLQDVMLLAEGTVSMSPIFSTAVASYDLSIASDSSRLRLIPLAVAPNALIHINVNDNAIDKNLSSGTTSSVILLDTDSVTRITIEVRGKAIDYYTFNVHYVAYTDIDEDDDGLIEIRKLEDLQAIRYNLYGSAYKATADSIESTVGCPEDGCVGYELITDLDFNDATSYRRIENKDTWTEGEGWQPIGSAVEPFTAIFRGNGKTIHNLTIKRPTMDNVALFSVLEDGAEIDGVGLLDINVLGKLHVGGLVALNFSGTISNSYVDGDIRAKGKGDAGVGGLVGWNNAIVENSYVIGHVVAENALSAVGGLVGWNLNGGVISNCYAMSHVEGGDTIGGLVGLNSHAEIKRSYAVATAITDHLQFKGLVGRNVHSSIKANYWDRTIAKIEDAHTMDAIASGGVALTTVAMQMPTAASTTTTDVYFNWSSDDWDFGTSEQYPVIKYNHSRCNDPLVPPCNTIIANQNDHRLRNLVFLGNVGLLRLLTL